MYVLFFCLIYYIVSKNHRENVRTIKLSLQREMLRCLGTLTDQSQTFQLPGMLRTGGDQIDPGCFYTAVPQYISQTYDIFTHIIKACREEMPEIVGKNL